MEGVLAVGSAGQAVGLHGERLATCCCPERPPGVTRLVVRGYTQEVDVGPGEASAEGYKPRSSRK